MKQNLLVFRQSQSPLLIYKYPVHNNSWRVQKQWQGHLLWTTHDRFPWQQKCVATREKGTGKIIGCFHYVSDSCDFSRRIYLKSLRLQLLLALCSSAAVGALPGSLQPLCSYRMKTAPHMALMRTCILNWVSKLRVNGISVGEWILKGWHP